MPNDAINLDYYAPRFRVEIGGETISMDGIVSVEVDENLENPAMFTINFNETLDPRTQRFAWMDNEVLTPGAEVKIYMGYTSRPTPSFTSSSTIPSRTVSPSSPATCPRKP